MASRLKNIKKARQDKAKQILKKPAGPFIPIDLTTATSVPKGMTRAFSNNRYVVMVYDNELTTKGNAIRVMVQRHDDKPIPNHWKEMFEIKNTLFGEETVAIEYYPAKSKLVDLHNIYWMWIFQEGTLPLPITP